MHFLATFSFQSDMISERTCCLPLGRTRLPTSRITFQEWRRRKSLIKATIPPEFLLEWFLKYLLPYISKDVSTSGVTNEEEAILRAHQLDLIYSQSRILYEITPKAPRHTDDANKPKTGPHADGVVGSVNSPTVEYLAKQLHSLSVKHSIAEEAKAAPSPQNENLFA